MNEQSIRIALAGNPNAGKTTLFNALTGSNQFVGNWPGVTVEKKEGKLKSRNDVIVTDLPGIYSLSPYSLEEVVARNYLVEEKPDVILNIVDGTNIVRNLYLTTQLIELGIPVVVAINMMLLGQGRLWRCDRGRSEYVQRRQHGQSLPGSTRQIPCHRGGRSALPAAVQRISCCP